MGSLDSAEATDLVGIYIIYSLAKDNNIDIRDIGLYSNDGLIIVRNATSVKCDQVRTAIHRDMKDFGLKVEVNANLKQVNFLDVTLDLDLNTYKPYVKDNANPIYIHPQSNHPPSIIKHIPLSIESRKSNNSSDEVTFNHCKAIYNTTL